MTHAEHQTKRASVASGFFAQSRAVVDGLGEGVFSNRSSRTPQRISSLPAVMFIPSRRFLVALLVAAAATLLIAANANAQPPLLEGTNCVPKTHTSIAIRGSVRTESSAHWMFSYSKTQGGPWTPVPGGEGTNIGGPNGQSKATAELTGLTPEVRYYVLLTAENTAGEVSTREIEPHGENGELGLISCETIPFRPVAEVERIFNVTSNSGRAVGNINPRGLETHWRFEYSSAQAGPWTPLPGGEGTISQGEAEATVRPPFPRPEVKLASLSPSTTYYARLFAENEPEPGVHKQTVSQNFAFQTGGPPFVTAFTLHALHGEAMRLIGLVTPNVAPIDELQTITIGGSATAGTFTLSIEGHTTEPIPFIPHEAEKGEALGKIQHALEALPNGASSVLVESIPGGGYKVEFAGSKSGVDLPQMTADASGLTPSGTITVATLENGADYSAHYHFEYVSQTQFEAPAGEGGFAKAKSTSEVELGSGRSYAGSFASDVVGIDVPDMRPDETYRYRLSATNSTQGDPVEHSAEQNLHVPTVPSTATEQSCPNEAFRVGPSASLPDCRAYEQVTPVDKEGAEEPFHYGIALIANSGALIGEDGNHFEFDGQFVHWGTAGESPYFFSRSDSGWHMVAATPQPEAGIDIHYEPELYSPDLTQFAFQAGWNTGISKSSNLAFMSGPPGGPYATPASVARQQTGSEVTNGWVAASEDFSKLIFATEDRTLIPGHLISTQRGSDLYEYSDGKFSQANVDSSGMTIGLCGATVAEGDAETQVTGSTSTRHSVSADGTHVFFYAVPSGNCAEPAHLYVHTAGAGTTDLGAYTFLAANQGGTEALLEARSGTNQEVFLSEVDSNARELLFTKPYEEAQHLIVSEDFSTIYVPSNGRLTPEAPPLFVGKNFFRYDMGTKALSFAFQAHLFSAGEERKLGISRDGRYAYIQGEVAGTGVSGDGRSQVYRYDSSENLVECLSCASPFDPKPSQPAVFTNEEPGANSSTRNAMPREQVASDNGDYVFFDTRAALVPRDVNGEIEPEAKYHQEYTSTTFSPSNDVYEWRKPGVNGCTHVQGCISLISSGRSGKLVMLLGVAHEGRDVFFSSAAQLGPNDNDNSGDVYDARIGGGEPPAPPRPVECEGDACSTPANPPNDATPSSFTFTGIGNFLQPSSTKSVKSKKPKVKKHKKKPIGKHRIKKRGRANRSTRRSK